MYENDLDPIQRQEKDLEDLEDFLDNEVLDYTPIKNLQDKKEALLDDGLEDLEIDL